VSTMRVVNPYPALLVLAHSIHAALKAATRSPEAFTD
jgi:hypothetical protein